MTEHKIVMDFGTYKSKVGFAHEDAPRDSFPTVLGQIPRSPDVLVGHEAIACTERGFRIRRPIEHGVVTNWDDMQELWGHTFDNVLRVDQTEFSVLNTETPENPIANREKACEIMFEIFDVPYYFSMAQPILALYASGRVTGLVVGSGHSSSCSFPIYEGNAFDRGVFKAHFSGDNITYYLSDLLGKKGINLTTSAQLDLVRDMKEKHAYIAVNYDEECQKADDEVIQQYQMPDGQLIDLGRERFMAPEALFRPSVIGLEHDGIHTMAHQAVEKSSIDVRRELYGNILLSGGSTLYPGFPERLQQELMARVADSMKVQVLAPADRKYYVWIGGTILCTLTSFQDLWITKQEFEEAGPSVAHRTRIS